MWKRHNPFYLAAVAGVIELALSLAFVPRIAYVAAANAFFVFIWFSPSSRSGN